MATLFHPAAAEGLDGTRLMAVANFAPAFGLDDSAQADRSGQVRF